MDVIATKTTIGHKVLSVFVAIVLVLGLSPAVPATNQVAWADGEGATAFEYDGDTLNVIAADGSAFGMFAPQDGSEVVVTSDAAKVTLLPKNKTVYAGFYLNGDIADSGTWEASNYLAKDDEGNYSFELDKSACGYALPIAPVKEDGVSTTSKQYYLAIPAKDKCATELAITNNTGMFKAVTASAVKNDDGSAMLTMALSSDGYHYLYKGTYEQAAANGANVENWIAGAVNDDGKWEFQIPITADELGSVVPVVAISDKYHKGYEAGENAIERAFYPRQMTLSLEEATLVTGDFESSKEIAVTNNVSMFRPAATATLDTTGGPNSNNYESNLVLPMQNANMSEVFVGTPTEASEAESTIALADDNTFTVRVKWVEEFGKPETTKNLANGEPFVMSFKSANNGKWYGREATLDEEAGTLVFDPWIDPAPANTVDEKIAKIQSQTFTDTTYADCEDAKAAWDALSDDEKKLVEEYDYFGLDTGDASKDDPLNQDKIGEKEILVVSFGTSFNDNRVATIGGIEKAIKEAYPEWSVRRAFTAQIIINHIYARDGEKIDNMKQALDRAVANGVKELVISPTHLMKGAEFDELVEALAPYQDKMNIRIAEPLLGEVGKDANEVNDDKLAVAKAVVEKAAAPADTALVLMGHGTAHDASISYEQMQTAMNQLGYGNVFVGTVEGEPEGTDCASIIAKVKEAGFSKVILRPLMVVAGDHANNDMADPEDEESWFSQFVADEAFSEDAVTCQIAGLGEIAAVQQIYVEHIADVLGQWKRLRGNNQYDTMQQVSAEGWASASAVILATGENFPDALSAAGAAGFEGAPVLITETSGKKLSAQAAAELKRLAPKKIIAVGGKYAMPQEVVDAAMAAAGTTEYVRLKGSKASGTAAEINKAYKDKWGDTAFLATSLNFPDALSAAPLAYSKHIPIFLVDDMDTVSEETVAAMKECGIKKVIPLGGKYCVSATAKATLSGLGFEVADALKGATAYETAKAIAEYGMAQGMTANKMGVACGQNFPDALTGAALCGKNNAVLVLADGKDSGTSLPIATANKDKIGYGYVFGGKFAVPQEVMDAFEKASL